MSNPPGAPSRSASIANGPPSAGVPPASGSAAPPTPSTPSQQNLNQIVCSESSHLHASSITLQYRFLIAAPHANSREYLRDALFIFLFALHIPLNNHSPTTTSFPITSVIYSASTGCRVAVSRERPEWIHLVLQEHLDSLRMQPCQAAISLLQRRRPTPRPVPLRRISPSRLTPSQTDSY